MSLVKKSLTAPEGTAAGDPFGVNSSIDFWQLLVGILF